MSSSSTLVLGIGNNLLTDEGAGIHVVNYLLEHYPDQPHCAFIDGGTLSFSLAGLLAENDQLIVVDAARTGQPAGSVVCYEHEAMDRYLKGNRESVHEVGLGDLLDIARLSDHYPLNRALIGIEPDTIEWGEAPSAMVAPAIKVAAEQVISLIEQWSDLSVKTD